MLDRVEVMKEAREDVSVNFMKFTRIVSKDRNITVLFFEGEDRKYYQPRIDLLANLLRWEGVICGGKGNVLRLFKAITENEAYKESLTGFFIDRDFDQPIGEKFKSKVYETPCYSIENLYTTDYCLSRILEIEFKLKENVDKPELYNNAHIYFKELRKQFHQIMRPVNIWIKAQRKKELEKGVKILKLSDFKLNKIVKMHPDHIVSVIDVSSMSTYFPDCHAVSKAELTEAEKDLPTNDCNYHFRGKYELEFVINFLMILRDECKNATSPFYFHENKIKLGFSKVNCISELSQYAETPLCLKEFLSKLVQNATPVVAKVIAIAAAS